MIAKIQESEEIIMASKRSIEERIREKDERMQELLLKAKQYEAQKKQLEKQQKEQERRARTHRLITIGGVVESILGRPFMEGDDLRLKNFLKTQERNGGYFTKAMNKDLPAGTSKPESISKPQAEGTKHAAAQQVTEGE